jgi:hypothetical protein
MIIGDQNSCHVGLPGVAVVAVFDCILERRCLGGTLSMQSRRAFRQNDVA